MSIWYCSNCSMVLLWKISHHSLAKKISFEGESRSCMPSKIVIKFCFNSPYMLRLPQGFNTQTIYGRDKTSFRAALGWCYEYIHVHKHTHTGELTENVVMHHGCISSLVLMVTGHGNVKGKILTPTESTPLKRLPKTVTGKYDCDPYLCAKSVYEGLYKWAKYNEKVVG